MATDSFEFRKKFRKLFENMAASADRKLTDEQADAFFKGLSHYDIDILGMAVDNLISSYLPNRDGFHSMPTVSEIINEIKRIRTEQSLKIVPEWCDICHNSGLVVVERSAHQPLAYRCECKNGDRQDRGIKPWSAVKEKYQPPDDVFPSALPLLTVEMIDQLPHDQVFDGGCEVGKVCATCEKPYSIRHERPMTKKALKEFHSRTPECEPCYIERGRRAGLWT